MVTALDKANGILTPSSAL